MKKKIMVFGGGFAVLAAAAFVVAMSGVPKQNGNLEKLRGTDAYYEDSEVMVATEPAGDLLANLNDGTIVKMKFDIEYRVGKEWLLDDKAGEAASVIGEKAAKIRSQLIILLGAKSSEDLRGPNLLVFTEETIRMLNDVCFPKRMARVEDIVFKELLVQK